MRAGRRDTSDQSPRSTHRHQFVHWHGCLQLRQQFVFLIANILAEERGNLSPQLVMTRTIRRRAFKFTEQLVDLLVFAFDPQREVLPVDHLGTNGWPKDRLLGESVREYKSPLPVQKFLALAADSCINGLQQPVKLDVVPLLAHQDARRPAELVDALHCDG